ncbi:ATP-binding protein, partial [Streptomyces sp. PGLac3x]
PRTPRPHEATSGRGRLLVAALADDWGVRRHGVGKAVWFELGPTDSALEHDGQPDAA